MSNWVGQSGGVEKRESPKACGGQMENGNDYAKNIPKRLIVIFLSYLFLNKAARNSMKRVLTARSVLTHLSVLNLKPGNLQLA